MPQLSGTEEPYRPQLAERLLTGTAELESLMRGMYSAACRPRMSAPSSPIRSAGAA
jgi:hypothetical protein